MFYRCAGQDSQLGQSTRWIEGFDDVAGGAKNWSVCESGHPSETKLKSSRLVSRSSLSVGRLKGKRTIGGTKLDPQQLG